MTDKDKKPEFQNPTDYQLPRVSGVTIESIFADIQEQGINAVIGQADERLQVNNPEVYNNVGVLAVSMLGPNPDHNAIRALHRTMILTHELLRRQAEADALGAMLSRPES